MSHVSSSFGNRKPPYSNWHYTSVVYFSGDGTHESHTARTAHTIRSREAAEALARQKVGRRVGFGQYKEEIVTHSQVLQASYRRHPKGMRVKLLPDCRHILATVLSRSRPPSAGHSREEHDTLNWLDKHAGREFDLMHPDDVPQMSNAQFYNTMPEEGAPAGFFIPKGLCEEVPE